MIQNYRPQSRRVFTGLKEISYQPCAVKHAYTHLRHTNLFLTVSLSRTNLKGVNLKLQTLTCLNIIKDDEGFFGEIVKVFLKRDEKIILVTLKEFRVLTYNIFYLTFN